jgi:hypothetical protein
MGPYSFEFPEQGWHLEIANSIYNATATNQEFVDAINHRFYAINVKKTQSLVKTRKTHKEALDIHKKIKIITSDDSTFALWSEVIASHRQVSFWTLKPTH